MFFLGVHPGSRISMDGGSIDGSIGSAGSSRSPAVTLDDLHFQVSVTVAWMCLDSGLGSPVAAICCVGLANCLKPMK